MHAVEECQRENSKTRRSAGLRVLFEISLYHQFVDYPDIVQELWRLSSQLEETLAGSGEDTDVRDRVCGVLQNLLLEGDLDTKIGLTFGVLNPMVNMRIRSVLNEFARSAAVREFVGQIDADQRIAILKDALTHDKIVSARGTPITEILGEWV